MPRTQQTTDESGSSMLVKQSMLEAPPLPNNPRPNTFLDIGRQLPKIMPKLHDRFGSWRHVEIADTTLTYRTLD